MFSRPPSRLLPALFALALAALAACGTAAPPRPGRVAFSVSAEVYRVAGPRTPGEDITLTFAGDTNFVDPTANLLADPRHEFGSPGNPCPNSHQKSLAAKLAAAGEDVLS